MQNLLYPTSYYMIIKDLNILSPLDKIIVFLVTSLLMLYPVANLANLLMWGLVVVGGTWAYAKYR